MTRLRHAIWALAIVWGLVSWDSTVATVESRMQTVTVCFDPDDDYRIVLAARARAERMFEAAGVRIDWRGARCPAGAIRVVQRRYTAKRERPGALAHATLSTRTVTLYYDRMRADSLSWRLEHLLAHVLVHEITHILQGHYRHSATGLMKAVWDRQEYWLMERQGLEFTPEDVRLIHKGFGS
jgi:hypothetical protein